MKYFGVVLSCILAVVVLPAGSASAITGGAEVSPGRYPWLVKVGNEAEGYCSGSLVSARHVLTAAHCVGKETGTPSGWFAHFLGLPPPFSGFRVGVIRTERHPSGIADARNADIALLTLEHPVFVRPISVVASGDTSPTRPGSEITVAGYGKTRQQQGTVYRARELNFKATNTCARTGRQWFCADAPSRDTGIRPEDSGGPAFTEMTVDGEFRYVLLGTSSNHRGANTWFANLSLPAFNDWIHDAISGDRR
ncbi:secreted trypsin-like serine protease [Kibdelosporangium banguiense]|uniref:Secreted trypsin-like serine protease n=1 Tax=Kibdelosporangium banguiense TaxID=1365924 RepID=A0ABS4THJ1_9PSEU|nr:trypsin-like serine protease [Kibdelosporangium banguiense]MBP2323469.1 secreted trypsin-like serine protease [Kibdelosporangium banguiense]